MSFSVELESGQVCVTGLVWDSVAAGVWKKEKKKLKGKGEECCSFEVKGHEGEALINYGLIATSEIPFDAKPKKGKATSLAGLLALSNPAENIIAVEVIASEAEPLFWFCAISQGQVVHGSDVVGSWDEISSLIQEYRESVGYGGERLIGSAIHEIDPLAEPSALSDHIDLIKSAQAGIGPLQKEAGVVELTAALGAVVAILACGYFFVFSESDSKAPRLSAAEIQQRKIVQSRAAMAAEVEQLRMLPEFVASSTLIHSAKVSPLPIEAGGWKLVSTSCSNSICVAEYSNANLSPTDLLSKATEGLCSVAFTTQGEGAKCVSTVQLPSISTVTGEGVDLVKNSAGIKQLRDDLMTIARSLPGAGFKISEAVKLSFPGREVLGEEEIPVIVPFGLRINASVLPQALTVLNRHKGIALASVDYQMKSKTVELSGSYFAEGYKK